jgi:hypothetical protein
VTPVETVGGPPEGAGDFPAGGEASVAGVQFAPDLAAACGPAVDPLEIAARLEAAGFSNQVVVDTYALPDVFALADVLYRHTPFTTEPQSEPEATAGGSWRDLARGALFALPTLSFTVGIKALGVRPVWWVLPAGLVVGWALSQLIACLAWTLRGSGDSAGEPVIVLVALALGIALSAAVGGVMARYFGGGLDAVLIAVAVTVYMVDTGLLLFYGDEWWLALALAPGAAAAGLYLLDSRWSSFNRLASGAAVATVVLATVFALRHIVRRGWRRPQLSRSVIPKGAQFFIHGACCGLLTSLLIGFESRPGHSIHYVTLVVWPLLLTLGLMEWQLRTLRGRVAALLPVSHGMRNFVAQARRTFMRSLVIYALLLAALSVAAGAIGATRHTRLMLPLLAQGILGLAFFVALVLIASGRVDLVVRSWIVALVACAGCLLAEGLRTGPLTTTGAVTACAVTAGVAFVMLFSYALPVVSTAFSY